MINSVANLLNDWFAFTNFKDFQTKPQNLLSKEYEINRANEKALKIVNDWDDSGILALIYVRNFAKELFKEVFYSVDDLAKDIHVADKAVEFYHRFNLKEFDDIISIFINNVDTISMMVSKIHLIGESKSVDCEKDIIKSVSDIVDDLKKLKFEVYKKGGEPKNIEFFGSKILLFESLAKCVLTLEKIPNSINLCYINNGGSQDGYFGYFVNNNGTLFSLHERIDEVYVGQHQRMRNGSWTEDKADGIFPYNFLFEYINHDYKGYATTYVINEDKLEFSKLKYEVFIKIIITIALIINKFKNFNFTQKEAVIIDSLLPKNLKAIEDQDNNALIKSSDSSIVHFNSQFSLKFDRSELLSGKLNEKFNDRQNSKRDECGYFPNFGQTLVDTYGDDFEYDEDELLSSNSSLRLIGDGDCNFEFVGSKQRMELQAYFKLRKKLADHIMKRQDEDFAKFGGSESLIKWYKDRLTFKLNDIIEMCRWAYEQIEIEHRSDKSLRAQFDTDYGVIRLCLNSKKPYRWEKINLNEVELRGNDFDLICPITGFRANQFFDFSIQNWEKVEKFVGAEVPKFIKGWKNEKMVREYGGNPILSVVDPIISVGTPIDGDRIRTYGKERFNFDFSIGIAKSALAKKK